MESGSLVFSLTGRDKNRVMIVTGVVDANYVYVADGKLRKVEKPKLKKLRHLREIVDCDEEILKMPVEKFTNRCIREKINAYLKSVDEH